MLLELLKKLGGHADIHAQRQEGARIVRIVTEVPAVMEHVFGTPLVSEILNQVIDKGECRILRQHGSTRVHCLESSNNGSRVTFGRGTRIAIKEESRHEDGARLLHAHGIAGRIRLSPLNTVRNSAVAKQRHHFLRIG